MISLDNIKKSYGDQIIFKDFSFRVYAREIVGIIGQSGVGKSTLFRILTGLENVDEGKMIGIKDIRFSVVFQEDRLCDSLSAIENIQLVCKRKDNLQIAQALCEILPQDSLKKPVSCLSGGMRRRVAIARAMLVSSDMIIMDEPFRGLDDANRMKVIDFICKYRKNRTLCLFVHEKEELKGFSNLRIFDISNYQC